MRPDLRIEEQSQARIEEVVDLAVDQAGRRQLLEMVILKIECAAYTGAKIVLKCRDRERAVESIEKFVDLRRLRGASEQTNAQRSNNFHLALSSAIRLCLHQTKADLELGPIVF